MNLAALAGLAGLAKLAADALVPAQPTSSASSFPSVVYLLRPEDYAHPARVAEVRAAAEARGGRWVVIGEDWRPLAFFETAAKARFVLRGAGFRGPGTRGLYSVWRR
jgi:hypothetical protein